MLRSNVRYLLASTALVIVMVGCGESPRGAAAPAASTPPPSVPTETNASAANTNAASRPAIAQAPANPPNAVPSAVPLPADPTSRPAATPPNAATADPLVAEFLGFTAPKPAAWQWAPPKSTMRAVNYLVPGESGDGQADVIVFKGVGGGRDANIERWKKQFRSSDQTEAVPIVSDIEIEGIPVSIVELVGERMNMGQQWYTPDQVFLAAIILAPEGDIFVTISGPTNTVEANRDAFMTMIHGLQRK